MHDDGTSVQRERVLHSKGRWRCAYVGLFALVSVATGRYVFHDTVPWSTWVGLAVILIGSLIIHVGSIAR